MSTRYNFVVGVVGEDVEQGIDGVVIGDGYRDGGQGGGGGGGIDPRAVVIDLKVAGAGHGAGGEGDGGGGETVDGERERGVTRGVVVARGGS